MVFNATINNISVLLWRSVLLLDEAGENHRLVASHFQTLSHNVVSSTPRHGRDSNFQHSFSVDRHWLHRLSVSLYAFWRFFLLSSRIRK